MHPAAQKHGRNRPAKRGPSRQLVPLVRVAPKTQPASLRGPNMRPTGFEPWLALRGPVLGLRRRDLGKLTGGGPHTTG